MTHVLEEKYVKSPKDFHGRIHSVGEEPENPSKSFWSFVGNPMNPTQRNDEEQLVLFRNLAEYWVLPYQLPVCNDPISPKGLSDS